MLKDGFSEDGLHPNAEGFALMAPVAEAAIEKALKR
jgi:lysophospholipase L1-like esterase